MHDMDRLKNDLEDIQEVKRCLVSWIKEEVSHGKECFDTKSCGDVSDIVKDLAEAEKECYEAQYYKTIVDAMHGVEGAVYGYNHRHMANGQFAGAGSGHYVRGYTPGQYDNWMPGNDANVHDPNYGGHMMGYDGGNGANGSNGTSNYGNMSSGMTRDGDIYDRYRTAKRHYQASKNLKDKENMETQFKAYVDSTLKNMRAMWSDADPKLKERMKAEFGSEMADILEGMGN